MQKIAIYLLLLCFVFASCKKNKDSESSSPKTGYVYEYPTTNPVAGATILTEICNGSIDDWSGACLGDKISNYENLTSDVNGKFVYDNRTIYCDISHTGYWRIASLDSMYISPSKHYLIKYAWMRLHLNNLGHQYDGDSSATVEATYPYGAFYNLALKGNAVDTTVICKAIGNANNFVTLRTTNGGIQVTDTTMVFVNAGDTADVNILY